MPVLVNEKSCLDRAHCYAAAGCPYDAYYHNALRQTWEVEATKCGDCPGPCLNFCDADAVRWADNLFELGLLRRKLAGELTDAQVAEARAAQKAKEAAEAAAAQEKTGGIVTISTRNFQAEVLQATIPVVMDCWAAWCGPCRTFAPIFAATAKEYVGIVKFVKLDTDKEQRLAGQLGIKALPTTLFFYNGQLVHAVQGAIPSVADFSGLIYQILLALQQMDPQAQTAPAPPGAPPVPAPEEAAPPPTSGVTASGLILGPDPGPPPAAPPARRPTPPKPRLYRP